MRRLAPGDRLVVATHNPGKLWEFDRLLAPHGLDLVSAGGLGLPEPEETEPTFSGNAKLKALPAALKSGLPALGDDSGLEVAALGGAPGVLSARWAGPDRDFNIAMQRVHDELAARDAWPNGSPVRSSVPPPLWGRTGGGESQTSELGIPPTPNPSPQGGGESLSLPRANFIAVLCLAWPDGETRFFEGRADGRLVWPPRGGNGFGYDPMFLADGETETFGEMEPLRKYAMSHRTRAFRKLVEDALA